MIHTASVPAGFVLHDSGLIVPESIKHLEIPEDPLDTPVAVGSRFAVGVQKDGYPPTNKNLRDRVDQKWGNGKYTYNWLAPVYSEENSCGVKPDLKVVTLREALSKHYRNDAHLFPYMIYKDGKPLTAIPRINKNGLARIKELGFEVFSNAFFFDFDNPHHKNWSHFQPEFLEQSLFAAMKAPDLKDGFIYSSLGGYKAVVVPPYPIPVEEYELRLHAMMVSLQKSGLVPDANCKDWTHCFRTVFTQRPEDKDKTAEENKKKAQLNELYSRAVTDLDDLRRCEKLPEVADRELDRVRRRKDATARSRGAMVSNFAAKSELPANLIDAAKVIGKVVREGNQSGLHKAYLAMSVMMCSEGISPELVPALIEHICEHAGSKNPNVNIEGARRSAERWLQDEPIIGDQELANSFPHIHQTIKTYLSRAHLANAPSQEDFKLLKFEDSKKAVEDMMRNAKSGNHVIHITPGAGKTHAAINYVVEQQLSSDGEYRAGITSDTNVLAKQTHDGVFSRNGNSLRVFGPTSVSGKDECKFKEQANAVAAGGQSPFATMCLGLGGKRCEHFDNCKAKDRQEGDAEASIMIGSHRAAQQIMRKRGVGIDFFVDEPPSPVVTTDIPEKMLERAVAAGPQSFKGQFITAIAPILDGLTAWVSEIADINDSGDLRSILTKAIDALDHDKIVAACKMTGVEIGNDLIGAVIKAAALSAECADDDDEEKKVSTTHKSPPIKKNIVERIRRQASFAKAIGEASKVFNTVLLATRSNHKVMVTCIETSVGKTLQFIMIDETMDELLASKSRADSRTMILDGTSRSKIAALKMIAPDTQVHEFNVDDAHRVKRVMNTVNTSRKKIFTSSGEIHWDGIIGQVFAHMANECAKNGSKKIAICTFKPLRIVLQYALKVESPDIHDPMKSWIAMGRSPKELESSAARVRDLLKALPKETKYVLYHYGAERGRNDALDADTSITIGDPRPNVEAITRLASFTGEDPTIRIEQAVAESLSQAHARLRHVSPYRAPVEDGKHLYQAHYGQIVPFEPQWHILDRVEHVTLSFQQSAKRRMSAEEFCDRVAAVGMSLTEAAAKLGVSTTTVQRWAQTSVEKRRLPISEADAEMIKRKLVDSDMIAMATDAFVAEKAAAREEAIAQMLAEQEAEIIERKRSKIERLEFERIARDQKREELAEMGYSPETIARLVPEPESTLPPPVSSWNEPKENESREPDQPS